MLKIKGLEVRLIIVVFFTSDKNFKVKFVDAKCSEKNKLVVLGYECLLVKQK